MQLNHALILVSASLLLSFDPTCGAALSENAIDSPFLREKRDIEAANVVALIKSELAADFRGLIDDLRLGKSLTELSRSKRDTDVAASELNIGQLLIDLINSVIKAQVEILLKPIKTIVNSTLDTVVNLLMNLYTAVPPQNGLDGLIAGITNTAIRAVVEIVELVRRFLNSALDAITLPPL